MKHSQNPLLLAILAVACSNSFADTATTKGGFQIKSDDGNFEAKLSGRIHFDANLYLNEDYADKVGSRAAQADKDANSQFFMRRARLTLEGRAYDYNYKFENDFGLSADGAAKNNEGIREMWFGKKFEQHNLRFGQAKPYRSMEELTSSNEVTMMERPLASHNAIFRSQFTNGIFFDGSQDGYGYGVSLYTPRQLFEPEAEGLGLNARIYGTPLRFNDHLLHIGFSATEDNMKTFTTTLNPRLVGRENGLRSTNLITANVYDKQTSLGLEAAYRFDKLTIQGEYMQSTYEDDYQAPSTTPVTIAPDQKIVTHYVQTSYFLSNHRKIYDVKKGVFKSPKVSNGEGAIELKARYDHIENKDKDFNEGFYYAFGVNYYPTENTRFMLEYVKGKTKVISQQAEASAITARAQFTF